MARKLSQIARCVSAFAIVLVAPLAIRTTFAQDEVPAPASATDDSHASAQSQPRDVPGEPQTSHRPSITYQNPFAATSKLPPVDTSLRPGPVSRWRRPNIPTDETSAIKSAILATQASSAAGPSWDELPAGDDLRHRTSILGNGTGITFQPRPVSLPDPIHFAAKSLAQPAWMNDDPDRSFGNDTASLPLNTPFFNSPLDAGPLAEQAVALSAPGAEHPNHIASAISQKPSHAELEKKIDVPPATTVSSGADTPDNCLHDAQQAAANADSAEELTAVIKQCDRGLAGGADGKVSNSLRRLSAWAHNRRGELQADIGRNDDSLNDFQKAIALDANCSLAIHNRAVSLAQQNKFDAALSDFNRVIELNPGLAVAYRNRAELLAALGRMDEAVADYNHAIESTSDNAQLYRGRAYAHQRLGHFQKALADINRALEISPNDAETLTQRGNLAAEQGDYEQASASFQKALSIEPKWADAYRSQAWLAATCPNPRFHNPQQAITAAEQAAKLSPGDDYLIFDTLAAAHASAGHYKQAVGVQQKALTCAPPQLATSLEQRLALYKQGQAYLSPSTSKTVRTVSHETPAEPVTIENRTR